MRKFRISRSESRSLAYWERQAARYFDAALTDDEERALRRFLASPAGADARFDDVRAVMGFLVVARRRHEAAPAARPQARRTLSLRLRYAAAAAVVVAVLGGAGGVALWRGQNVCVAYAGGRKLTDREAVMQQARASLRAMERPADVPGIEAQLGDMLATPAAAADTLP